MKTVPTRARNPDNRLKNAKFAKEAKQC